ncbi:MAG: alpha/beta hydrolase [Bacteroidota bacterium]
MKKKIKKAALWTVAALFVVGNVIAYNHAYRFTHFKENDSARTQRPEKLSLGEKLNTLLLGINIPKPKNEALPTRPFETLKIESQESLEAWRISITESKGILLMFHGYCSSKSGLLAYSEEFNQKGYSTVLVDFMGSGGSTGHTTTVGYKESRDVKEAYEYVKAGPLETPLILFGSSMGAVAIMKAIADYDMQPEKIIIECPFGSMLETTKSRFRAMNLPPSPLAEVLLFYGGLATGFNPFGHQPTEYAKQIEVPTLLLYGAKDKRVSREEIDEIYDNLSGEKELVVLENSEHEVYLNDDRERWNQEIDDFLNGK